jgi:MFS family permease
MHPVLKKLGFSRDDRVVIIHTEDIGIAATVYALWNAFIDPLFGYINDNTRSKRGRRIPYMRFTAPFLALTFILVGLQRHKPDSKPSSGGCWSVCCFMIPAILSFSGLFGFTSGNHRIRCPAEWLTNLEFLVQHVGYLVGLSDLRLCPPQDR